MTTMRPIRETIPLEEAIAIVAEATATVERVERVPLREAGGRVIAEAVAAPTDVPPFDRAAMDGYAVIAADTFGAGRDEPRVLRCIETVFTGQLPTKRLSAGECTRSRLGAAARERTPWSWWKKREKGCESLRSIPSPVSSTMTTASAPSGSGAPVAICVHSPADRRFVGAVP